MHGHGRPEPDFDLRCNTFSSWFLPVVLLLSLLPATICQADTAIPRERLPISWQDDAELTDVFFLDANVGWAVGAQGVILKTSDGGQSWQKLGQAVAAATEQLSLDQKLKNMRQGKQTRWTGLAGQQASVQPLRCRFESVYFSDANHGWVAGGYDVPHVDRSRAVVMRTVDGGVTWVRVSGLMIPRIHKLHFSTAANGWAVGEASRLYPTGIFFTSDGGRSWSSGSSIRMSDWRDAAQVGSKFVTVSNAGQLAVVTGQDIQWSAMVNCPQDACVNCVHMIDSQNGWAAGEGGLLVRTDDGGISWQRFQHQTKLPIDFTCVTSTVNHLWLSGNPGNTFYRLDKDGHSIEPIAVPQSLPIRRLAFSDSLHGFAVGDLATILATTDGGKTWQRQHGEHRELALLAIADRHTDIPLEVLSRNAGEENRVCGTLVLNGTAMKSSTAIQAAERVGSSVNWLWPSVNEPGNANSIERTVEQIQRLAVAIRTLRPAVIVCQQERSAAMTDKSSVSLDYLVSRAMARAARDDASADSELSLPAWQVERLVVSDPAGELALDPHRLLPTLGIRVSDQTALSRALLVSDNNSLAHSRWRVAAESAGLRLKGDDMVSGLGRGRGGVATRTGNNKLGNLNGLNQAVAKQKQLERFAAVTTNSDQQRMIWQQQLQAYALSMDETVSGLWLVELAEQYVDQGQFSLAADTLQMLTTRWPDHAWSPAATIWLSRYYSSHELAQFDQLQRWPPRQESRLMNSVDVVNDAAADTADSDVIQATHVESHSGLDELIAMRTQQAARLLGRIDPDIKLQTGLQWTDARIAASLSGPVVARKSWQAIRSAVAETDLAMADAAQRELRLLESRVAEQQDDRIVEFRAAVAKQPPRLDGKLDDVVWQKIKQKNQAARFQLQGNPPLVSSEGEHESDQVMFAIDQRFFYAAYRCQKLAGPSYQFSQVARPRDPDLSRRDRVELEIDVDRDYGSSVTFTVDHRGWAAEQAWGGKGWNPDWYVAQAEDAGSWTVEIAIPLECFFGSGRSTAKSDNPWAIRVDRFNQRSESLWNKPADQSEVTKNLPTGLAAGWLIQPQRFRLLGFVSEGVVPTSDEPARRPDEEHLR